jgi:hypothetical protein
LFETVAIALDSGWRTPKALVRRSAQMALAAAARSLRSSRKRQYVYCYCTGAKGPCGNRYSREEDLGFLLGDVVKRVRIPTEVADA